MKNNKRIKKYGAVIWDTDPDHTPKSRFLLVSSLNYAKLSLRLTNVPYIPNPPWLYALIVTVASSFFSSAAPSSWTLFSSEGWSDLLSVPDCLICSSSGAEEMRGDFSCVWLSLEDFSDFLSVPTVEAGIGITTVSSSRSSSPNFFLLKQPSLWQTQRESLDQIAIWWSQCSYGDSDNLI